VVCLWVVEGKWRTKRRNEERTIQRALVKKRIVKVKLAFGSKLSSYF